MLSHSPGGWFHLWAVLIVLTEQNQAAGWIILFQPISIGPGSGRQDGREEVKTSAAVNADPSIDSGAWRGRNTEMVEQIWPWGGGGDGGGRWAQGKEARRCAPLLPTPSPLTPHWDLISLSPAFKKNFLNFKGTRGMALWGRSGFFRDTAIAQVCFMPLC